MLFHQMPAAWTNEQGGCFLVEPVGAPIGILELDGAADGIAAIDLSLDHIIPSGRKRILKVGHKDLCNRMERSDHHLALSGTGDLDAAVVEVSRGGSHLPFTAAHRRRAFEKAEFCPGVDSGLAFGAVG